MKRKILFLVFLFSDLLVYSQDKTDLTDYYLLNFTVPDMPAFKALGTDPSNILRPSDVQKFAAMLSPFYSNGKTVVPKNFALEFSPGKLSSSNWHLQDYKGFKKFWYNTAFSIGTLGDSASFASKLSLGFRTSLVSKKGDILNAIQTDTQFMNAQSDFHVALVELRNKYRNPTTKYDSIYKTFDEFLFALNKNIGEFKDTDLENLWGRFMIKVGNNVPDSMATEKGLLVLYKKNIVDAYLEDWKKNNWNATRFDLAIAWVGESPDSLLKGSQFSSFNGWATYAMKVGKGGQLLLGTSLILPRSISKDTTYSDWTVNLRFYLGTNNVRGFLESQFRNKNYSDVQKALLLNLGAEFRIGREFWVQATAGINNYIEEDNPFSKLVSSLDIRYGFNR
jgi:hypothetical protein